MIKKSLTEICTIIKNIGLCLYSNELAAAARHNWAIPKIKRSQ